jgi:hypothetical protein
MKSKLASVLAVLMLAAGAAIPAAASESSAPFDNAKAPASSLDATLASIAADSATVAVLPSTVQAPKPAQLAYGVIIMPPWMQCQFYGINCPLPPPPPIVFCKGGTNC